MADGSHFARERLMAFTPWHPDAVSGSHPPHLFGAMNGHGARRLSSRNEPQQGQRSKSNVGWCSRCSDHAWMLPDGDNGCKSEKRCRLWVWFTLRLMIAA